MPEGVWSEAAVEDEEGDGEVEEPEPDIAASLNASAVWLPESGGLMARTMPFLQSSPTEEKNLVQKSESADQYLHACMRTKEAGCH